MRMASSALTDRRDDPVDVGRWPSGPHSDLLVAVRRLVPCLSPKVAPSLPALISLTEGLWQKREPDSWHGAEVEEEGARGIWRLYFCLRRRRLLCNPPCFWQAGGVFTCCTFSRTAFTPAEFTEQIYCAAYQRSHLQGTACRPHDLNSVNSTL